MSSHLPVLIVLIPFFAAIAMPMIGLRRQAACRPVALTALSGMSIVSLLTYGHVLQSGPIHYALSGWDPPLGIEWVIDGLSGIMLVTLSLISVIVLLYAGPITPRDLGRRIVPWYTMVLMLMASLAGMVLAADLFNLFVFLEVASLCSYALIGAAGGHALLAAFRYLIIGTIGASLYLLGVAYIYAATGTLNIADIAQRLPALLESRTVIAGLIFILIGLSIKMALVPLHGWLPDAYRDAPDAVTPLIASLVTKVALFAIIRIIYGMLGAEMATHQLPILLFTGWAGAFAMVIGAFLALSQQEIKPIFAYAGISHLGLVMMGIAMGNATGFAGGVFYLINEMVMQATLFCIAGAAFYRGGVRSLSDLARLRGQVPWTLTALIVTALSMIGIPPTGGFFGKWYILLGALKAENYIAVIAIVVGTLLTMGYFLKLIQPLLLEGDPPPKRTEVEAPFTMRFAMGVLAATTIALGIWSDRMVTILRETAIPVGL
ncbi:MAG TPA: hydrogenase 4 subunit B [Candidatus Handelsmanbacteria bacterium]|nr:hydrogenase 4 subunit B [Candidatus Handelsmanbacteria bacterium]